MDEKYPVPSTQLPSSQHWLPLEELGEAVSESLRVAAASLVQV